MQGTIGLRKSGCARLNRRLVLELGSPVSDIHWLCHTRQVINSQCTRKLSKILSYRQQICISGGRVSTHRESPPNR